MNGRSKWWNDLMEKSYKKYQKARKEDIERMDLGKKRKYKNNMDLLMGTFMETVHKTEKEGKTNANKSTGN